MKKNSEILYEIALKLSSDKVLLEHSMSNKTIYGMLMEDIEDSDIEKLRKAVQQTVSAVDINLKASNTLKLGSLVDYLTKIKGALKKADALASKLDLSDPDTMLKQVQGFFGKKMDTARALQAVIDLQNKSNTAGMTIKNAIDLITKNLEGKEIDDDVKLAELDPDKHGLSSDDLKSGVSKAFKGSKPKGFMAKLGSLLGKSKIATIPGAEDVDELPVDKLADDILAMTYGELKDFRVAVDKSSATSEKAAVPTDAIKSIQTSAEEAPEPGKEEKSDDKSGGEEKEGEKGEEKEGEKGEEEKAEEKGDDAPPKDPEKESDPAKEIKAAAAAVKSKPMSPKDAVAKALSDWESSLSKSSQETLKRKNRSQELRDGIFTGIDKGKAAVQRAVAKAVKDWRGSHEEALIKSKRFAKKNFDSLQNMIPALAAEVLAQTKESRQRKISKSEIRRFVHKKLDEKFLPANRLFETWQKNAGLLKD